MLTTEQLERIAYALAMGEDRTRENDQHAANEMRLCSVVVNAELCRRRHEQRRARKAAKNREMYRTFGERPWDAVAENAGGGLYMEPVGNRKRSFEEWMPFNLNDALHLGLFIASREERITHLREPSGFSAMDRVARELSSERC